MLLPDLETIKRVMVEKQNKNLKAKGKAATACLKPRVIQSARLLGAQLVESLRRVTVRSFASIVRPTVVPTRHTTPWTAITMTAVVSPSRQQQVSSLSPRRPTGGKLSMAFMQHMFEAYTKANKKAGKSKKCKKRDNDSSDSSNSEKETGYSDMGLSVDKHLKIDKPFSTVYLSTEPRPIKVVDTALSENIRANKIAIKTAKTGKVTAVVAVLSIYCKKMQFVES